MASRTGMTRLRGRSAAVTTAVMPGAFLAAATSSSRTSPCAAGERTTRACSCPGALKSSPNRPRPRSRRGSSALGSRAPMAVNSARSFPPGPGGGQDRLDDALVAGAPAQVRRDELAGLLLVQAILIRAGLAALGQVGLGQHEESWRAEPALQGVMVAERLLQVRQLLPAGQPFHRADLGLVGLYPEDQAGADRLAVHEHRAGAADAVLAAEVGAGVAEVVPEHVGQRPAALDGQLVLPAVHRQGDRMRAHVATSLRAALTSDGSTGMWSNLIAVPDSASLTALRTAAGAPIVPPSPMPLAPVSLNREGVSRWTMSTGHISAAVGAR